MVNQALEGKRYPRTAPYLVGREKLREFAKATMLDESLLREDAAAPTTFPVVIQEQSLKLVITDPEAGLDFSRVVHGEQRFVYTRPIVAGDELTSELSVASIKTLGGNQMITFNTEIFDAQNQLVCTAISTLVVRGENA
jgi:N-terminal half of MaoC dehydratase